MILFFLLPLILLTIAAVNFVQIRTIIDEELEGVWSGKKQPKEALDLAIKRGNEQLERFEKANK